MRAALAGLSPRRLALWLGLFCLALALPAAVLIHQAFDKLKWEALHQQRSLAEELVRRIDRRVGELLAPEQARGFADYGFAVPVGDPAAGLLQRSPLALLPAEAPMPGLIGHFQVDAAGGFATPLLPTHEEQAAALGLGAVELAERRRLARRIVDILSDNRLVSRSMAGAGGAAAPAELWAARGPERALEAHREPAGQSAFDRLTVMRQSLRRDGRTSERAAGAEEAAKREALASAPSAEFAPRADQARPRRAHPEPAASPPPAAAEEPGAAPRILAFAGDLDGFEFSPLDSGHLVLFRKAWRDGQRYVQGLLIDREPWLVALVAAPFREAVVARSSDLVVAFGDRVLARVEGAATDAPRRAGILLNRSRLSAPFADLELVFHVDRLPQGPGAPIIAWLGLVLGAVLLGGCYLAYRLMLGQIQLARQQQDFVSAVSHELKTPLTSIRMYGEMLNQGWAPEDKKRDYYRFICEESERLTRLINNVLQLARLTRNELQVSLRRWPVPALIAEVRAKLASQAEAAGFELRIELGAELEGAAVDIDADWFAQILINLVDNALKFSARAERRCVEVHCRREHGAQVLVAVRDYGPGVPREQMKKMFRLFYRPENELTRETLGTGIGLALVRQLAGAMGGSVEVVNREPGAEFQLRLALAPVTPGAAPDAEARSRPGAGQLPGTGAKSVPEA